MFSFHVEQSEKIMPRATARIQSDLRSKSIKEAGRVPAFFTREEKCARRARLFVEIRSKAWFRARSCSQNDRFGNSFKKNVVILGVFWYNSDNIKSGYHTQAPEGVLLP